jgi:hypothetical protein
MVRPAHALGSVLFSLLSMSFEGHFTPDVERVFRP